MNCLRAICIATVGLAVLPGCLRFHSLPLKPAATAAAFEARSLDEPALREFVDKWRQPAAVGWPPAQWDFPTLTLVAFYFHPSLDTARAQWGVARAGVKTAGGRPNPVLNVVPGYSMNPASGLSPWLPLVNLDVPIETAGKRGLRVAHAENLSEAARLNIAATAWQVRSALRVALLDYASAQRRAELLQQLLQLQQQIITLLEQRLQAGAVARSELTLPRITLARTGVDFADATRQAAEARARIAEALGVPAKATAGAKFEARLPLDPEAGKDLASAEVRQRALLGRPDILAALAEYAASESALRTEIARQYPDLHLNPGYQFDQGEHKWSVGLSADLPVLNQNQGPIAEATARRDEAAARFLALQAKVIGEIDRALAARLASLDQVTRQRGLTQLAREQSSAVDAMFKAGAADKLELSNSQLEVSVNDLAFLDAEIKAHQAIAQLEDAVQHPLEAWPALEQGRSAQAKGR